MGWSKTPNEASQARVGKNGEAYNTLKARLDAENERVTTQLAHIVVDVTTFGAKGDNSTINTRFIDEALTSTINNGQELFFPSGVYLADGAIIKNALNKKVRISGKDAIIKLVKSEETPNLQAFFHFSNVNEDFKMSGITVDANNQAANPLYLQNESEQGKNVDLVDCAFINGKQTDDTPLQSGVYVRGAFNQVYAYKSTFKNMNSVKTDNPVSRGLHVAHVPSLTNAYTKDLVVEQCVIENVYNDTSLDSDGLSHFNAFVPNVMNGASLKVFNTKFINCKTRSIKSQVQNNIVKDCEVIRTNTDGTIDFDFQYAGAYVFNNTFEYNGAGVGTAIGGAIRDNLHNIFDLKSNVLIIKNGAQVNDFISVSVQGGYPLNNVSIEDNKTVGKIEVFASFRGSINVENIVRLSKNIVETNTSFIKLWRYGNGVPSFKVAAEDNIELGLEKSILTENANYAITKFVNNRKITVQHGTMNTSSDVASSIVKNGLYSKKFFSGQIASTSPLSVNVDWLMSLGAIKLMCIYSLSRANNAFEVSTLECIVSISSNGLLIVNEVRNDNGNLGVFNLSAIENANGLVVNKTIGTTSGTGTYLILAEGIERG